MENEIWKDIKGYEGHYQVSNLGRIRNNSKFNYKGRILKPFWDTHEYVQVRLYKMGKNKSHKVHRLVAETFLNKKYFKSMSDEDRISIKLDKLEVNHKDENPKNNKVDNLEWCTPKYNKNYGNRIKKFIQKMSRRILQFDLDGNFIREWESIKSITEELKISKSGISNCAKGKFKQFKGYIWKYKEGDK